MQYLPMGHTCSNRLILCQNARNRAMLPKLESALMAQPTKW